MSGTTKQCPTCKTNAFVSPSHSNYHNLHCNMCDLHFDERKHDKKYPHDLNLESKQTLKKLKRSDRNYYPIWWLREEVGGNFTSHTATLHNEGYIEKWGAKESPWMLTDKGKQADISEL